MTSLFPVTAGQRLTPAVINHAYSLSDTDVTTVTAASFADLSSVYQIPASNAAVGVAYRLTAAGNGTQGSTAQSISMGVALAGSTLGITPGSGNGFAATSTAFRWVAVATLIPVTIGATATWQGSIRFTLTQDTAGSNSLTLAGGSPTSLPAQDSTTANDFSIQAEWASGTGSPTITCVQTTFERLG